LGFPVWRALGNTAETNLEGFRYIYTKDKTAVFVDARNPEEFKAMSVPGAVNIQKGWKGNLRPIITETRSANRVIVFGKDAEEAHIVAEELAKRAVMNGSFFGGTFEELRRAALW